MTPSRWPLAALALLSLACDGGDTKGTDPTDSETSDSEPMDSEPMDSEPTDTEPLPTDCDGGSTCDGCIEEAGTYTCDCAVDPAQDLTRCRPIRVAVLDDEAFEEESSGTFLVPSLQAATWTAGTPMFTVEYLGPRWDWNGERTQPVADTDDTELQDPLSTDNTDVVFLLEGIDYYTTLSTDGASALDAFVQAGGGLVRFEWGTAYSQHEMQLSPVLAYSRYIDSTAPKTWKRNGSTAPLAALLSADLPPTFTLGASIVDTTAKDAATTGDVAVEVVMNAEYFSDGISTDVPALAYWPAVLSGPGTPHGTIVWVNHDLAYRHDPGLAEPMNEPHFQQLMQNTARAAASRR